MSETAYDQNPTIVKKSVVEKLENIGQKSIYKTAQIFLKATKEIVWHGRFKVTGAENIPAKGSAIVAANHPTYIDETFLMAAIDRPMRFIGRQEKDSPLFVKISYPLFGVIPASRHIHTDEKGKRFIRQVEKVVKDKDLICIFPEILNQEEKTEGEAVGEFAPGVVHIVKKYNLPVIPVFVHGTLSVRPNNTNNIWERIYLKPVELIIGRPIPASEIQNAEQIRQIIIGLKNQTKLNSPTVK